MGPMFSQGANKRHYKNDDVSFIYGLHWMVKNLLVMQKTRVRSLGQEDPPEKEMATRSSVLAWRIPWTEEPGGLQSMGSQRVVHNLATEQK